MADEKREFQVEIICPDRVFYTGTATMIELNTVEGEVGILKGHIPVTTIIAPGFVSITNDAEQKEALVHSGFVEILPDKVSIMAEVAEWPDEIDLGRAQAARERAEKRLAERHENLDVARAELALRKALLRIDAKK